MSYCRADENSSVYMIDCGPSIECIACKIGPKKFAVWESSDRRNEYKLALNRARRWLHHNFLMARGAPTRKPRMRFRVSHRRHKRPSWQSAQHRMRQQKFEIYPESEYIHPRIRRRVRKVGRLVDRGSKHFKSRRAAVEHLQAHVVSGDQVPEYAMMRLKSEIETIGDRV